MSDNTPSIPPTTTWPQVAGMFVRELPYLSMTVGGAVVAIVLVLKGNASSLEELGAVVGPAIIAALARSKPTDGSLHVGLLAIVGALIGKKFGA